MTFCAAFRFAAVAAFAGVLALAAENGRAQTPPTCTAQQVLNSDGDACVSQCPAGEQSDGEASPQCQACPDNQHNPDAGGTCGECPSGETHNNDRDGCDVAATQANCEFFGGSWTEAECSFATIEFPDRPTCDAIGGTWQHSTCLNPVADYSCSNASSSTEVLGVVFWTSTTNGNQQLIVDSSSKGTGKNLAEGDNVLVDGVEYLIKQVQVTDFQNQDYYRLDVDTDLTFAGGEEVAILVEGEGASACQIAFTVIRDCNAENKVFDNGACSVAACSAPTIARARTCIAVPTDECHLQDPPQVLNLAGDRCVAACSPGQQANSASPSQCEACPADSYNPSFGGTCAACDGVVNADKTSCANRTVAISLAVNGTLSARWSGDDDLRDGEMVPDGTRVTFVAAPDAGFYVTLWTGCAFTDANTGARRRRDERMRGDGGRGFECGGGFCGHGRVRGSGEAEHVRRGGGLRRPSDSGRRSGLRLSGGNAQRRRAELFRAPDGSA